MKSINHIPKLIFQDSTYNTELHDSECCQIITDRDISLWLIASRMLHRQSPLFQTEKYLRTNIKQISVFVILLSVPCTIVDLV